MKNIKIIRPAICLLICIIAIIVCLVAAQNFQTGHASTYNTFGKTISLGDYSVTDYSYYGGDAYTGIQQAGADASNNVIILGITVTEAANMLYDAQKNTANNVAALALPINATSSSIAAIGSLLSTALALAFALPGMKNLFELIQAVLEVKEATAAKVAQQETPAEPEEKESQEKTEEEAGEETSEEVQAEGSAE